MELASLKDLIDMLRANGITSYKNGDLELQLGAAPAPSVGKEDTPRVAVSPPTELEKALSSLPGAYRDAFEVNAGGSA